MGGQEGARAGDQGEETLTRLGQQLQQFESQEGLALLKALIQISREGEPIVGRYRRQGLEWLDQYETAQLNGDKEEAEILLFGVRRLAEDWGQVLAEEWLPFARKRMEKMRRESEEMIDERQLKQAESRQEAQRRAEEVQRNFEEAIVFQEILIAQQRGEEIVFQEIWVAQQRGDFAYLEERRILHLDEEAARTGSNADLLLQESRQQKLEQLMELFMPDAVATVFRAFKPIMEEEVPMMQVIRTLKVSSFEAFVEGPIKNVMDLWRKQPALNHRSLHDFCEEHANHLVAFYMLHRASPGMRDGPLPMLTLVKNIFHHALSKIDFTLLQKEGKVKFPVGACVKEVLEEEDGNKNEEENDPGQLNMQIERLLLVENQSFLTGTLLKNLAIATGGNNEWTIDLGKDALEKTCLVYTPGL